MRSEALNPTGVRQWESIVDALWHETCALLKICRDAEKKNPASIPSADSLDCPLVKYLIADGRKYREKRLRVSRHIEIPNPYMPGGRGGEDEHLREGLFKTHYERRGTFPRLAKIVSAAYKEARLGSGEVTDIPHVEYVPSPLAIVSLFLTAPARPETHLYAYVACRNWLSRSLYVGIRWPDPDEGGGETLPFATPGDTGSSAAPWIWLSEEDVLTGMESFRNYEASQIRWPEHKNGATSDVIRKWTFVGHLIALQGRARLRFEKKGKSNWSSDLDEFLATQSAHTSVKHADIHGGISSIAEALQQPAFRGAAGYDQLPSFDEIANRVFGLPIPIRGMDATIGAGLRTSSDGGLVVAISGKPGTGKTALALALANALAPFKLPTIYIALEETEGDLRNKLRATSRRAIAPLSIERGTEQLFRVIRASDSAVQFDALQQDILAVQEKFLDSSENLSDNPTLPARGMVVIDNINLATGQILTAESEAKGIRDVERFISACRMGQLITVIIGADDLIERLRIDYRSDVVFTTRYADLDDLNKRPFRTITVSKLRHQSGRQGTQLMHIGGSKGFRIVPHMDSLMALKETRKRRLVDRNYKIDIFKELRESKHGDYLTIFPGGNILLHGYGSSGKAGLGLRLLLTKPELAASRQKGLPDNPRRDLPGQLGDRRVLALSFLYPESYYDHIIKGKLSQQLGYRPKADRDYRFLAFYPGALSAQDFLYKIVSMLDEAIAQGAPFTGVMIDGIHNVFLQYPKLQDDMLVGDALQHFI